MLWLALHLPSLSLEAFCATLPAAAGGDEAEAGAEADDAEAGAARPVALVAEHRISDCNATAADRGVRAGQKRATALALVPRLLLGEADAARDAAALRAVAHAALTFTPSVTLLDGPATVLMEVQASLRLFGGLASLHGLLREALAPLSHRVQIAAAPTALGAAVLARWPRDELVAAMRAARTAAAVQKDAGHEGPAQKSSAQKRSAQKLSAQKGSAATDPSAFDPVLGPHAVSLHELERLLDRAPVWLLGPGREHWEALQGMGLHTLADLRALPRAGLARRFGEGLLLDLDRALGVAPDPRRWLELPTRFESRLELHQRADSAEQVLTAASVLLARLVVWAQARHGRIAAFTLAMQHEPRHQGRGGSLPATELRVEMAEPALDAAHLQLLLRERLARIVLAAPTLELRLRCRDLVHGAPPNGELFPTRASEAIGLARLLERLRARLGDAQVQRLEPVADHRPERGSRGVPALAPPKAQAAVRVEQPSVRAPLQPDPRSSRSPPEEPSVRKALPLHRPVWLLPTPVPLPERHGLPVLDGQPLQLVSGPERIEAGWWDGAPAARDYFIAMAADGSLVWVWRNRVPSSAGSNEPGEAAERGQPDADVPWMLQGRFG